MASFRQKDIQTPHFKLPFQFGGINGGALMNEQDTPEDVVDCIRAIIAFPIDSRHDLPEFGIPDLLFRQFDEKLIGQVRTAIDLWEDRPVLDVEGEVSLSDTALWNLLIKAGVVDNG